MRRLKAAARAYQVFADVVCASGKATAKLLEMRGRLNRPIMLCLLKPPSQCNWLGGGTEASRLDSWCTLLLLFCMVCWPGSMVKEAVNMDFLPARQSLCPQCAINAAGLSFVSESEDNDSQQKCPQQHKSRDVTAIRLRKTPHDHHVHHTYLSNLAEIL